MTHTHDPEPISKNKALLANIEVIFPLGLWSIDLVINRDVALINFSFLI